MNPKSECLRSAMPDACVAQFLQGRRDPSALLGTIRYLDNRIAELEATIEELRTAERVQ
jgi:hypothetical protein